MSVLRLRLSTHSSALPGTITCLSACKTIQSLQHVSSPLAQLQGLSQALSFVNCSAPCVCFSRASQGYGGRKERTFIFIVILLG